MKRNEALKMAHGRCHVCAPKEWRSTPDLTGDYDMDATILHRSNSDLPNRLELYTKTDLNSYSPRTGYNSYHGYSGDD